MSSNSSTTPRSSSRSKRSTTNLANLRLAPLTAKYTDDHDTADSNSLDGSSTDAFTKLTASHRSAPTSPGILSSSSSSRRYLAGLSRRSSLYENEREDERGGGYASHRDDYSGGDLAQNETRAAASRLDVGTAQRVPKAKSEAALGVPPHQQRQRLSGPGVQVKRKYDPYHSRSHRASGATTPRVRVEERGDDDWLAHAGRAASGIIQEQKGTSFLSVQTAVHIGGQGQEFSDDEDEDEGYEEMAALSAMSRSRSGFAADDEMSPVSTRTSRWGSRYGSRRTSRRGSVVGFGAGVRTPRGYEGRSLQEGEEVVLPMAPDFVDEEGESSADGDDEEGMLGGRFSSLGGIVDKIIGTNFFHADPGLETSASESEAEYPTSTVSGGAETETDVQAKKRIEMENARRKGEKERLRAAQQRSLGGKVGGEEGAGWEDARWFLGRVREAWG